MYIVLTRREVAWAGGKEEGKAENSRNIAKQMNAKGFDISLISELTGLSKEEVEKL